MRPGPARCTSRRRSFAALPRLTKNARASRVLLSLLPSRGMKAGELGDHQHVEDDHRRQAQDHRPNADGPKNVLGTKTLLFSEWIVLGIHDAPAFLFSRRY